MKKIFYLFLLPLALLMSCNDDKDFSPVDLTLTLSGVTVANGQFYTVAGENVTIENLEAKAQDGRNTGVNNVIFDLSGIPLIGTPGNPFSGTIPTENLQIGTYSLGLSGNLLQVESSLKYFAISYPLTIVENSEDLPEGAPEIGTYSLTDNLSFGN